jgi:DNA-binding NarL/FixJ family response regulator
VADNNDRIGRTRGERNTVAPYWLPLLVLPCVDSTVRSNYFAVLQSAKEVELLPVALASTLAFRAQTDRPDVIVVATEQFLAPTWHNNDALRAMLFGIPTLLLAAKINPSVKQRAARFGIYSALPMEITADQLLAAIAATASGLTVVLPQQPPDEEDDLNDWSELAEGPSLSEHLTMRETEVLRLMAGGQSNRQIAARLGISEHTAKFHVSSVLAKLGAASRTEAVTIGITRGLVAI